MYKRDRLKKVDPSCYLNLAGSRRIKYKSVLTHKQASSGHVSSYLFLSCGFLCLQVPGDKLYSWFKLLHKSDQALVADKINHHHHQHNHQNHLHYHKQYQYQYQYHQHLKQENIKLGENQLEVTVFLLIILPNSSR